MMVCLLKKEEKKKLEALFCFRALSFGLPCEAASQIIIVLQRMRILNKIALGGQLCLPQ